MFKTFQVGIVAACIQSALALFITSAFMFAAWRANESVSPPAVIEESGSFATWMEAHVVLLRYSDFSTALGLALTQNRFIDLTAGYMRKASWWMHPFEPDRATEVIYSQLMIAAICFAIATLRPPPGILNAITNEPEYRWIVSAIWSGAMSALMAGFGANATAARRAI